MGKKNDEQKQMPGNGMEELVTRDDALFDALGKSKKKKKRKLVRIIVSIVVIIAIVLTVAVNVLQRRVRENFASAAADVLTYEVTTGTISTLVSGSGTLQNVDTETVTIPQGVEVRDVLVKGGETVTEGQLLATVDLSSVSTAMATFQETIEDLDDQISDAEDDKVSSTVKAGVAGRVKAIYAQEDMAVSDCMVEYGALALLSLDGYMAVEIETDKLNVADEVILRRGDGEEMDAKVERVQGGLATVLVSDNGPMVDEEATILTLDGQELGSGKLYIHNPLAVTGYAGTVSRVNVKENQKVYANTTIVSLTDTASSANYDTLLRSRSEAERTLLDLLTISRNGGIPAPISGSVYSITEISEDTTEGITDLMVLSADKSMAVTITVDEADILSLEVGQEVDVTVSSVSEDTFSGFVTEIDRTASSGYYTAEVTIDKAEGMLPGMTASVDVRIQGVDNALIVPVDAVHHTSNSAYVYTSYDEETQQYGGRVDVVTGLSNSNYIEIKSGLKEGDTVYYTESTSLADFFAGMGFGNMGGSGIPSGGMSGMPSGGMSGMPSGGMPGGSGGQRPGSGGNRG